MLPEDAAPELGLRGYLQVVRRRKRVIALSVAVVLIVALTASYAQTPRYAAQAELLLNRRSSQSLFDSNAQQNAVDAVRSVKTEIGVVKTAPVRDLVRRRIGSAPKVQVSAEADTDLVNVRAESPDAARAALVANTYATAYIDFRRKQALDDFSAASGEVAAKIADIQGQVDSLGSTTATLPACVDARTTPDACSLRTTADATVAQRRTTLISQLGLFQQRLNQLQVDSALASAGAQLVTPASPPETPFAPTPMRNAILAIFLGLVFGVGLAFLVEYLDDSIKGKEDFERAVPGLGILGLIPLVTDWKSKDQSRLVSITAPTSPAAEAYRIIQVTSASAQEGKTTTLANLAVAFASSGLRTVAVCCDLRRPRLHEFFDLDNAVGFTSVLLGHVALSAALQQVPGQERLLLLASGPLPPNPAELLSSGRAADLLRTLATQADIVLIDSPPVLPVTDSLVLSQRVDSTVLVSSALTTTRKAAARATEMLLQVNAPLVGAVLNGVTEESGYGGYASRYYTAEPVSSNGRRVPNGDDAGSLGRRRRQAKRAS